MALFMQLVKYSAAGAKGHLEVGFRGRVDATEQVDYRPPGE